MHRAVRSRLTLKAPGTTVNRRLSISPPARPLKLGTHPRQHHNESTLQGSSNPESLHQPPPSALLANSNINFSLGGPSHNHEPTPDNGKPLPEGEEGEVSDMEWNLRVGRAIYLLETTLPQFFSSGLVTTSHTSRSAPPHQSFPSLTSLSSLTGLTGHEPSSHHEHHPLHHDESIYSKHIKLTYTPPEPLPQPLPQTFGIEGYSLYTASAAFVRTSMMALYSNCSVDLTRMSSISVGERERELKVGMIVSGKSRLTGANAEWDVQCTYVFSPRSGLIHLHKVQSIDPAPHSGVYNALRNALVRLIGPQEPGISSGKCPTSPQPSTEAISSGR